ncbi:hypothetical protein BJY01DRAFT_264336 [Aspergillus pseudoustus]|uniref:Uncharacterized protein n=1 Tax=Aspergillus pseudoustus TaxID=1810923 RepID=A0ABR4JT10_9EURO
MSSFGGLLIRRGAEMVSAHLQTREPKAGLIGQLGPVIVILTVLALLFAIFWVEYTCTQVAATLAAVEASNSQGTYIRLETDDEEPASPNHDAFDGTTASRKPITSSLRSTIAHLRAHGGTFRAFRMYLAFRGFTVGINFLIQGVFFATPMDKAPRVDLIGSFLGQFAASMLGATWQMAWVHRVIADKSPRSPYRRKLGLAHWPRIARAAALHNALECLASSLPIHALRVTGWAALQAAGGGAGMYSRDFMLNFFVLGILPGLFVFAVSLPARVVFVRVAASMLPEEDEPIVSFDRDFGGEVKKVSTAGGGGGGGEQRVLRILDAWTTFDWAARKRYVKIILKAFAIELAFVMVGAVVFVAEMAAIHA